MPLAYTSSGIVLIGNGEEAGSWGTITNNNLEIINRLVSEAGTITLAGTTHTLSIADGTLSEGQYAVLVFGGAPSGTNTVTINPPDAKRVFIVKNDSGESVVLTQGSGGNVTVGDGKTAIVYSDGAGSGAAVVNVSDDFIVATLTDIGALTPTDGNFIVGNGSTWVAETGDTVLQSIGVTADTTELNYVEGVTSGIQTQLDAKAPLASPTFTNDVTISDTAPELVFVDTNGSSGLSQTALVQDADKLQFETRDSSGVFVGRDYVIEKASSGAQTHIFYLNDTERVRFAATGAIGLNGENYGTSGQVLTSAGIAAPPSWQTLAEIGVGQTWQIVSRSDGVSYQNTTGKPIMAMVQGNSAAGIYVDGILASGGGNNNFICTHTVIVPNGSFYVYYNSSGSKAELR